MVKSDLLDKENEYVIHCLNELRCRRLITTEQYRSMRGQVRHLNRIDSLRFLDSLCKMCPEAQRVLRPMTKGYNSVSAAFIHYCDKLSKENYNLYNNDRCFNTSIKIQGQERFIGINTQIHFYETLNDRFEPTEEYQFVNNIRNEFTRVIQNIQREKRVTERNYIMENEFVFKLRVIAFPQWVYAGAAFNFNGDDNTKLYEQSTVYHRATLEPIMDDNGEQALYIYMDVSDDDANSIYIPILKNLIDPFTGCPTYDGLVKTGYDNSRGDVNIFALLESECRCIRASIVTITTPGFGSSDRYPSGKIIFRVENGVI